jgi:hypothetical protein
MENSIDQPALAQALIEKKRRLRAERELSVANAKLLSKKSEVKKKVIDETVLANLKVNAQNVWNFTFLDEFFDRVRRKNSANIDFENNAQLDEPIQNTPSKPSGHAVVDVCIVTDCSFSGGNASSTIDEIRYFRAIGLTVAVVHLPLSSSRISKRYEPYRDVISNATDIASVQAALLIVRGPRVVLADDFANISKRLIAKRTVFVINNSSFRPTGDVIFKWSELLRTVSSYALPNAAIYPIGPAIRSEAITQICGRDLAPFDWTPTFDSDAIEFAPSASIVEPVVLGRHGRDGKEKWHEDESTLLKAYPCLDWIVISILGGAKRPKEAMGQLPTNWIVHEFDSRPVSSFLASLDVFVYFPHSNLNEAFGRTIVEAMFAGLPCILPIKFAETFGDLAIYCEPQDVASVARRLQQNDRQRLSYVKNVRQVAVSRFSSVSLLSRCPEFAERPSDTAFASLTLSNISYKRWLELGD